MNFILRLFGYAPIEVPKLRQRVFRVFYREHIIRMIHTDSYHIATFKTDGNDVTNETIEFWEQYLFKLHNRVKCTVISWSEIYPTKE